MAQVKFYKGAFANYPQSSPNVNGLYYLALTDGNGARVYGQVKDGTGRLYTSNVFDAVLSTADDSSTKVLTLTTVDANGNVVNSSVSFYPTSKAEFDKINSHLDVVDGSIGKLDTSVNAIETSLGKVDASLVADEATVVDLSTYVYETVDASLIDISTRLANAAVDASITITKDENSNDYAAVYTITQGTKTAGVINIPKDMVVKKGEVNTHSDGSTYIDLTIANSNGDVVSVNVTDLIDIDEIDDKISNLDYVDTSIENYYVSFVGEVDGIISVNRVALPVVSVAGDNQYISAENTDGAVVVSATYVDSSTDVANGRTGIATAKAVKDYADYVVTEGLVWNTL